MARAGRSTAARRDPERSPSRSGSAHRADDAGFRRTRRRARPRSAVRRPQHGDSHSLGAVALVGTLAARCAGRAAAQPRVASSCAPRVASHMCSTGSASDTSPPLGVLALWPFTSDFYQSPDCPVHGHLAPLVAARLLRQNGLAALRELVILRTDCGRDRTLEGATLAIADAGLGLRRCSSWPPGV